MTMFMKLSLVTMLVWLLPACGSESVNNELIGQPKKVIHNTPILCPDYSTVDVSLGVIQNGVGSMSTGDQIMVVRDQRAIDALDGAIAEGKLVKFKYDVARLVFCTEDHFVTDVSVLP